MHFLLPVDIPMMMHALDGFAWTNHLRKVHCFRVRPLHAQMRQQTMGRQPPQMAAQPLAGAEAAKGGRAANGRVPRGLGTMGTAARRRRDLQQRQQSQSGDKCRSRKAGPSGRCATAAVCQLSSPTRSQLDMIFLKTLCCIMTASTVGSAGAANEPCNFSSDRRQDVRSFDFGLTRPCRASSPGVFGKQGYKLTTGISGTTAADT